MRFVILCGGSRALVPTSRPTLPAAPRGHLSLRARFDAAARLVADHRDVLEGRPGAGEVPPVLVARGWSSALLALRDEQLDALETGGHEAAWPEGTPPSLLALVAGAEELCRVPRLGEPTAPVRPARRLETPRKSAQIEAFAHVLMPLARAASRVVDVGSGHGHLTREIAQRIALPVVGLERDVGLAGRARALASSSLLSFSVTDVHRDGLALEEGDCVIGLHACGDLGDAVVEGAARRARSIVLVGCCLQKRHATSRHMLCEGPAGGDLELPRHILGLSNLTARDHGVEASRADNLAGRVRRLALHRLLSAAGPPPRTGAELEGLNRRAAQGDLTSLVARAFALRGLPAPPASAIEEAFVWAGAEHARVRRLSLPRATLARVLEVLVLLDRATYLAQHGFEIEVGTLFPSAVSARNLVLCGARVETAGGAAAEVRAGRGR